MATERENVLPYSWLLAVVTFVLLFYLLQDVLAPFLTAAILAYICNPLVDCLMRFRMGRTLATILAFLLLLSLFTLLLLIIAPFIQQEIVLLAQRLPAYLEAARDRLEPWLGQHFGTNMAIAMAEIQAMLGVHWQTAGSLLGQALKTVGSHGMELASWLLSLLLVPVVLFYVLRDWPLLVRRTSLLVPRRWHDKVAAIARETDLVLAEFLRGQLLVMLFMSVFYICGLWLVGLELALPIGLIAGLLSFVPYLGLTLGLLLAVIAAILQFASLTALLPVLLVFGLGQLVEGMLLTPWLIGERIGLHPLAVVFALLVGGQLFGFAGVLLALPAGAAIAVGLRHASRAYLASEAYLK